nr:T9SS type A sorting domain-containing protein [Bacteroidota bacterium]
MNLKFSSLIPLTSYSWAPALGLSCTTCANPIASPTVTTTYTVTTIDPNNGCTITATVTINVNSLPAAPSASIVSTPCGNGTAIVSALGSGGTLNWFNTSTFGTQIGTGSPLSLTITGDTTIYVSETTLAPPGCASLRTPLFIDISDPDTITATVSQSLICGTTPGTTQITLTATNISVPQSNTFVYTWTQSSTNGGLNSFTGASVTANPLATTTYTVTAFDAGTNCTRIKTLTVGVGAIPTVAPTGFVVIDACDSANIQLNANAVSSNFVSVNANIGTGTVQNSSTAEPAPYGNFWGSNRTQMLIQASELSAAGLVNGSSLSALKFDIVNTNGTADLQAFTISLGLTNATALTSGVPLATPFNVFGPVTYSPVVGLNTHTFSSPVIWDGVSSIVVNTCFFNPSFTSNCTFNQTTTTFISTMNIRADGASQCGNPPGTTFLQRPNIVFTATAGTTVSVSWSPSAGLSSSTIQNPTAKIAGTTTYTVTATENESGCSATASVTVVFTPTVIPPAPTATGDTICGPGVVNLSVTTTDAINNITIWTDTIGGQIKNFGTTYNPIVTQSGSYYVHEIPPYTSPSLGNNIGTSAGFFPDGASFMNFTVTAPGGIIINTVDVSTNVPATAPLVIALVNSTGQIVSVLDTIFIAGGTTALQTISLNLYVPQGVWRLQPILNPNLNVSSSSTLPATIPGQITVSCFGNVSNACFPINFNGLFYNWVVNKACISPAAIVNYVVNTPPPIGIASNNGMSFCDSINTVLTAVDSTLSGYDSFAWSPATGLSATTGASVTVSGVFTTTTYTVIASNSVSGCDAILPITLTLNPAPTLSLSFHDTTICPLTVPILPFNSTASKSSVVPIGNRFSPNFVNGQLYGGNTTQYSQMIFTTAELNAAGLVGPTNISSIAYFVSSKLTTTTYTVDIKMRADGGIPTAFPSTTHINTGLTTVYTNPAITSALGWNTYPITPFFWDGVSNLLVSQCFTHNIPGFFDLTPTSPTGGIRWNGANAAACGAATGAFIAAPNQNDRPNVRFTGGNVLFSWSPALGLSGTTLEDPTLTAALIGNNDTSITYHLTVTDPLSGCAKTDSIKVTLSTTPQNPIVHIFGDSVLCFSGQAKIYVNGTTGDFQWQSSADGINFTDMLGQTNDTLIQTISTTSYYRVDVSCGGDSINSRILTFIVNSPSIDSTMNDTICGVGTATLQAFGSNGTTLNWFANSTGGTSIGTGGSFTTPVISSTTTYYVQAAAAGSTTTAINAPVGVASGTTQAGMPFRGGNGTAMRTQYLYTAAELNAAGFTGGNWNQVRWTFTTAIGGSALMGNFTIRVGGTASTSLTGTFLTDPSTVVFGPVAFTPPILIGDVIFPFSTPFVWDGVSNVYIEICHDNPVPGVGSGLMASNTTSFTSVQFVGNVCGTPSGASTQTARPIINISGTTVTGCFSARVPVVAVSTPPPSISIVQPPTTICELTCTNLDVDASGIANYQVFNWSPATGLSATTGASVQACPLVTTTYIVTAFDTVSGNACSNSDTILITVTPAPSVSIATTGNPSCNTDSSQITATAVPFISPTGNYVATSIPFAPVVPSGGTGAGPVGDDVVSSGIPIGFNFNFYGNTFSAVSISTNGFISFDAAPGSGCCSGQLIPNTLTPNNVIALDWMDLNTNNGGTIDFFNLTSPNRFVVRYNNVATFSSSGTVSGEIILYQAGGIIEIHNTSITTGGTSQTQGVENATGTLATAVSGRNASAWNATGDAFRFQVPATSSLVYAWSPAAGLSSTSISNPMAQPIGTTVYTLTVTETGTGCSRTSSVTIVHSALPQPTIAPGDSLGCAGTFSDYWLYAVDTGAYAGGYPPGTLFDWSINLGGPVADLDSILLDLNNLGNITLTVTLPASLGNNCSGTTSINVNFSEPVQTAYMSQDSVSCTPNNDGVAYVYHLEANGPIRYVWVDALGDTVRDITNNYNYAGLFDADLDGFLDDRNGDFILDNLDNYNIFKDSLQNLIVGTYTVYITTNAGDPYPTPQCVSSGTINIGRTPCVPPLLADPCVCVDNADVSRRAPYTDGQFSETISLLGGQSPWTIVSLTSSSGRPLSNIAAIEDCIDNTTQTVPVTNADIIEVIPNDSSYINFYLFDGDTYTLVVEDASGAQLTISGGGCNYPAAPINDTTITVCADNFGLNIQDAAFPGGVDPSIVLSWYDDSLCTGSPLMYGDLSNVPANYPDLTDISNPGPGGNIGYTVYNFYVASDSVADVSCEGKRAMVTILSNEVVATVDSIVNVNCNGEASGAIYITMTNGTAPFTYAWSNGSTEEDLTNLVAYSYDLVVTDSLGCTFEMSYDITENPQFTIGKNIINNQCHGDSTGQILLFVSGAVPFTNGAPYSYLWSDGQTTNIANNLIAGTYTVTVTDSVGCDTTLTFQIFDPTLLDQTHTIIQPLCNGGTGDITVNAFGGTPWTGIGVHPVGYEFSLDGGTSQTSGVFTGIAGGNHTIAITDSNSCITYLIFNINEPAAMVCGGAVTNVMCNGGNNGSITANITGGTGNYGYLWNDGSTNQTINGLTSGAYTVTVTDGNGCTIQCTYTVTEPSPITFTATACANVSCFGGNDGKACVTNVLGGSPPYTYQWNTLPAQTTAQATGLTAGTWTVTVMDAMGCIATGDVIITQPSAALSITGTVTNTTCNGGNNGAINIAVTGGTAPTTLLWSNGNTTTSNTGLTAGTYTVTATDANNCTTTASYTLTQSAAISISLVSTNVSCNGGGNGSTTANASGGSGTYNYTWSNGASTASINGLGAGIYTITVTDGNGCTMSSSATITSPSALGCICNSSITNVSCFGGSNGSVSALPLGGTAPYSYLWNNGSTTQGINGLVAGTYTVTITDANGCTKVGTATVTQPSQLFVFVAGQNLTCAGNNTGAATATPSGGVAPYTYLWTPTGQTTQSATGLAAGNYTVKVTDANGCTATAQVTITQPPSMTLTSKRTNVSCFGGFNGTFTVVVNGGTPAYSYLWSNGKTTKFIIGLGAGTYTVTVTDAAGCTKTLSGIITQPPAMVALYTVTNVNCNGGSNGAIDLTVTGGTAPYTYVWSNGALTQDITGIAAGIYAVTVKDKKGCIINATVVVSQPTPITLSMTPKSPKCFGGNNGQATVTASGGTVPYSYLWSNGKTTSTATGLTAGTYTVTVTDSKACSATMTVTISQPPLLACTANVIQGILCNGGLGKIGVTATGGTPGYSYTWNTNPITTTAIANNVVAGTYTVIVKDKNNCTTSCVVTITQPAAITCAPLTSTPVSCNGANDGTATVSGIAGGTSPYTLLWNSFVPQTTPTATGLSAGTYTVTITDANGCTKTASVIVTGPTALTATYSSISPGCNGGVGTITVVAAGGSPAYSYTVNPGAINNTTGVFGGLSAGTYSVLVTDANLCTTVISNIVITSGNTITANPLTSTNVNCNGGNNGTASITGISGGLAPYTLIWSTVPVQGTLTATGLTAGTYTVTVTDANGCIYTAAAIVTEPSTPVTATINSQINIDCNGGGLGEATVLASGGSSTNSYLDNNFAAAFPSGLVLGGTGGCGTPYTLTFTSPAAIRAFIPNALGLAAPLTMDMTDPTNGSYINSLAGALVATTLNVQFDLYDANFAPTSTVHLADLIYGSAPFAGMTVQQILDESNNALAGCGSIYTPNQLRTVLQQINHSWENGVPGNGFLSCPVGPPGCNTFYSLTQEGWDATGGYTYLWSNGQTTATATGLTAGTYVVTVTDANGCTAVTQVTITQPGSLTVSAAAINALCNGGANGMVLASAQLGTPPYSFMISPMAGTQTNPTADSAVFAGLAAGTYTIIVTDAGDCTAETDVTVNEPSAIASNTTHVNVSCNGGSNGVATVYAIGGTPGYTYQWSNGTSVVSTNQQATGLPAGTYTVTVTDANGCINTGSTTIAQPAGLSITPTQVNVSCNGQGTGSATATVTGGTAPYNYLWNNGQQSSTATGLMAGTYTVTVTDFKGCTNTQSYSITSGVNIIVNPSQTPILCNGGTSVLTVNPTGGTGTYTYSWSQAPLNTTNTATVNAGVYYVTVTDGAGCSITYCFVVAQPNPVACAISSTGVSCNGTANGSATANVIGGTLPYSYSWNDANSQATQTAIGLGAGTYTVLVTDSNGCTSQCSITITEPQALSVGTSNTNVSCQNPTGTAVAIVGGGTAPYTYLWSNGASTSAITGLLPGTYTVTVNDSKGCGPVTAQATILAPVAVTCSATSTMTSCNGYHNATATVTPGGGNGVYSVIWNTTPAQTTLTATGMSAGTYSVVVLDGLGCSSTCTVVVQEPAPLVYSYNINNTCAGSNGGTSTINAMGGTMYTNGNPYTYLWNNGQTTQTATGLGSGTYYVTVTDSLGCAIQAVIIMPQAQSMTCNTFCTPTACGQATGTATVNVFGGTMPYTYQWSNGNTNVINTGLTAGTYTVLVTDAQGCTTMCIANVGQPANIQYTLAVVNPACNGGTGSVTITNLNGGMSPYSYLWNNGSTALSVSGLAGTYTVTVTDINSCSITMTATIVQPLILNVTTSAVNVTCNGYTNGSAAAVVSGGTAPFNYLWNTGGNLSYMNNLAAGTYTVTVTDANGCIATAQSVIAQPLAMDTVSTSSIASTCGLCNGSGSLIITGGTAPYSYLWSNGATSDNATGLCAGNNFVTVTDANGCTISVCVKVSNTGSFAAALTSPTYAGGYNIRCNSGLDGAVNLTVNPIGTYTYSWSNTSTNEDLFGVGAGTYTVTVSNGTCTQTVSITLTEAPLLTASATGTNANCSGTNTGTATALGIGGVMPYTYAWSNGQTTQTATGLMAGTYTVIIGDANGCTANATYTVTGVVNALSITETHVNPTCYGNTNGSIDITVTGGSLPYTYIWTGGATTEDRTNIGAGSHTVTVTDANGCTITLCVVVTQPNAIVISMSTTNATCNGGSNGSAAAAVSGGSSPYTYLWNTGANTANINGLAAGTYTVTVTDASGCTFSANKAVGAPVSMTVIVDSVKNVTANGGNNGAAYISLNGGTAPFVYSWNTIPVKTTQDVTGLTAGTYQVSVTDAAGCVANATITITQPNYICSNGTPFHTQTPAAWTVAGNGSNIGTYLTLHFPNAFPGSLVVGGGCLGSKTLTLTNATAVRTFLLGQPLTGGANLLSSNLNNPTNATFSSALAANIVALKLAVVFDAYDGNFAPVPTVWLANLIYNNPAGPAALNGLKVNQVLFEAEKKLGGCSSAFTGAQLTTALNNINLSYLGGVAGASSTMLTCPAPPKLGDVVTTIGNIVAYPNPTEGQLNIRFVTEQDGKVSVRLFDAIGRVAFNTTEAAFEGVNERSYDVSNLSKGVYMLNVQVNGLTETIRVVVK